MTDRQVRPGTSGLRRLPRPFFVSTLLALAAARTGAQDPMRPWLDWRTLVTPHYRFHFPPELEPWARAAAERVESVDSAIATLVGSTAPKPVDIVVDDPYSISNGYALPFIDRPVSVWWAVPPDPRSTVGNFGTWYDILSVHELTHIAHMTRPSRNPFQRHLWESLPVNLGPIARRSPPWLYEGYATVIEGRITGSGRPNGVWRPAILRQWAIEGRLPAYGQLSTYQDYQDGRFAYLGGSAFLEWLMQRDGDSSLVLLWRRMSARQVRTFDASFVGVFGDAAPVLYGRHSAELIHDAMNAKADLERAGLVEGELVQRLTWETGDPAVSPNGELVALTLRERDRPGRVVVWRTAPESEDTAAIRRRAEELERDPQDVPDRRFYPRPKRAVKTLRALNGSAFSQPRWLGDGKRLLVTRWSPRADASWSVDLYVWDSESGGIRRVTRGTGVSNGDPNPHGLDAVAMQCHLGHCDVVRVDLATGQIVTLLAGDQSASYYRPRYSPNASRIAASIVRDGVWRIVVANADGTGARLVDPDDRANRYDAEWLNADTLVAVSERGGIPNLELVALSGGTRTLTRVTGAAVAPALNRADSSLWFLAMHARGLDVRRLSRTTPAADSAIAISADRYGFAGVRHTQGIELRVTPLDSSHAYGTGPRHARWLPGAYESPDGVGALITLFSGDIVGRLNATATGALGSKGTWRGGSLRFAWRFPRPTIEFGGDAFSHEPGLGRSAAPLAGSLDARLVQAMLAAVVDRQGDGWRYRARVGGGAGRLAPRLRLGIPRRLGFGEMELQLVQSRGSTGLVERVRLHGTMGETGGSFQRVLGAFKLSTTGRDAPPFEAGVVVGRINGTPDPFEMFALGGAASPVSDSALLSQRLAMPEFPTGIAFGNRVLAWRVAMPGPWTYYLEGASASTDGFNFERWQRAVGVETRFAMPPAPAGFSPRVNIRGGAAYTLDAPFKGKLRVYLEMKFDP